MPIICCLDPLGKLHVADIFQTGGSTTTVYWPEIWLTSWVTGLSWLPARWFVEQPTSRSQVPSFWSSWNACWSRHSARKLRGPGVFGQAAGAVKEKRIHIWVVLIFGVVEWIPQHERRSLLFGMSHGAIFLANNFWFSSFLFPIVIVLNR